MKVAQPRRTRVYEADFWSSSSWDYYSPRLGDIVVATPAKTGTTWVQTILLHLIFPDPPRPLLRDVSHWLDTKTEEQVRALDRQTHRRFIKTHTPLDGLPYWPQVTYLVVGRDGRDAFMSAHHHENLESDTPIALQTLWERWITDDDPELPPQAPLLGERNGRLRYFCHFNRTFWEYRHLENIRFIHFNDLLEDMPGEISRIARLVSIDITDDMASAVAESVSLKRVKARAMHLYGTDPRSRRWADGLLHKGTNGRWRSALTADDIRTYRAIVNAELSPDCALWLERGRRSLEGRIRTNR